MPPKKEVKEKQVKGDEAEEMVLEYLKAVNRPYASTDVSANLKNKVTKPNAQKILAALAERGDLTVKTYGKQTIFVYNQANLPVLSTVEMGEIDGQLKAVQAELGDKRKELKQLEMELAEKEKLPKTKELGQEIERIKAANEATISALAPFRSTSDGKPAVAPLCDEEIKRIDAEFAKWRKEWTSRRKAYKELLGMMQEGGLGGSTADFEAENGIAPDEDEATEIENGEFCKPGPLVRKPAPAKAKSTAKPPPPASTASSPTKKTVQKRRAPPVAEPTPTPTPPSQGSEESAMVIWEESEESVGPKRKKGKK